MATNEDGRCPIKYATRDCVLQKPRGLALEGARNAVFSALICHGGSPRDGVGPDQDDYGGKRSQGPLADDGLIQLQEDRLIDQSITDNFDSNLRSTHWIMQDRSSIPRGTCASGMAS